MRIVIYEAKESMNLIPPHYVYVKISKEAGNDYFEVGKDEDVICDRKFHKEDFEHYDYFNKFLFLFPSNTCICCIAI